MKPVFLFLQYNFNVQFFPVSTGKNLPLLDYEYEKRSLW
jgi:hypothetical protein